ncbi:MAG: hypothetical protein A2X35_01500 [Elusimicrobia bacterium GWA2_61_42]|nr:MAG: hypothetical protein A2X35_01500 [Elusimicrobia bacterium GWA2_61_42]OGR76822.1 MAG: hypothetical protein A2X38_11675 [Elusimicrobia bacterium GWC2_61_25]
MGSIYRRGRLRRQGRLAGLTRLGRFGRLRRLARLAGMIGLGRMFGVTGLAGLKAGRRQRLRLEVFLLLHYFLNSAADVRQLLDGPVACGENYARGQQQRREHRRRTECFFH